MMNMLSNFNPKIPHSLRLQNIVCIILSKDCESVYIGETSCAIYLVEHKQPFKYDNLQKKLVNHSLDSSHIREFENIRISKSNCNNFKIRYF